MRTEVSQRSMARLLEESLRRPSEGSTGYRRIVRASTRACCPPEGRTFGRGCSRTLRRLRGWVNRGGTPVTPVTPATPGDPPPRRLSSLPGRLLAPKAPGYAPEGPVASCTRPLGPRRVPEAGRRCPTEPRRISRRLHSLRGWGHDQTKQVLPRSAGPYRPDGPGAARPARVTVGGDHLDRREDRLYGGDVAQLGAAGRA